MSSLSGLTQLATMMVDWETRVADADYTDTLTGFLPRIAEQEAGQLAGEFDSNLQSWAPLKPSTIKAKGHDRILFKTGALRESLVHIGGPGNIASADARTLLFGTSIEYGMFHQFGTRKMVARPPVGLSEESLDKLTDNIADATVEILMRG